ncbi:hypothetical protein [Arthrobacter antioxidans]|uniref:hypothetical protein n=1 Tax=Arthrobacter antioxidans TaxID=2895818 RepID=UPI001FFFEC63|nr:hypothetical protein [Arthrobacter antioxidans]
MHTTPVKKVLAAWLLGLVLVGAAFVATVSFMNGRLYSPEHQVDLYLEALRDGDGGEALGLLNASVPEGANPALLDGDALRRASAPVEDVDVGEARESGADRVEVPVTYTLDGEETTTVFPLRRIDTEWGFFNVWRFEESVLPTVQVTVGNSVEAAVNGVDVGLPDGAAGLASFYPAAITAQYDGQFFAAPEQHAVVTGREPPPPLALTTEATPELTRAVDEELRAFLDGCARQTVFQPTNCPFNYVTNERLAGDIAWSIGEYPAVSITAEGGEWLLAPLRGSARIDTQLRDFFSGAVRGVSETVPFEFEADLTVTGDEVTVTPVVRY